VTAPSKQETAAGTKAVPGGEEGPKLLTTLDRAAELLDDIHAARQRRKKP